MKKIVFALVVILFLTKCAGNDQANETPSKGTSTKTKDTKKGKAGTTDKVIAPAGGFKPDFIKSIPGSVDGCGLFFTFDTCKLKDEKYIFLSDMGDMAMIRIKGKDVILKKNKRESKQINAISSVEVFYAVGYKVVLRKKEEKVVDEFYEYSGTLQITGKKIKTTIKVHGEGGC